ncbi:MAG: hypothetical protein PVJ20_10650 [Desulfobacterales bacterium]|jgi:hypothetical protein
MQKERKHEMGPGGFCIFTKCGERTMHHKGIPCIEARSSKCSAKMIREDSEHYRLIQKKKNSIL